MKEGYFQTHPFSKAGFFAIPLLLFVILMERYFPIVEPEGYNSFVIAFEFAKTPEQIHTLFSDLSPDEINKINIGNYIDFGFMLTYVSFLITFVFIASKVFAKRWLLVGIPLSVIILFADFYENILLLQITDIYTPLVRDIELKSILNILHKITWVKWGGLAVVFAVFSVKLLGKSLLTTIEGIVCIVPLIISFFALTNDPTVVWAFTFSIFVVFFVLIMFSFTYRDKEDAEGKTSEENAND